MFAIEKRSQLYDFFFFCFQVIASKSSDYMESKQTILPAINSKAKESQQLTRNNSNEVVERASLGGARSESIIIDHLSRSNTDLFQQE